MSNNRVATTPRTTTAPDGGYGWVIVVATFFIQAIFGGFVYSFGLYFLTFLEVFGEDRAYTAWIQSSMTAGFSISGTVDPL